MYALLLSSNKNTFSMETPLITINYITVYDHANMRPYRFALHA